MGYLIGALLVAWLIYWIITAIIIPYVIPAVVASATAIFAITVLLAVIYGAAMAITSYARAFRKHTITSNRRS